MNPLRDQIIDMIKNEIEFGRSTYPAYVTNYNNSTRTINVKLSRVNHGGSTSGNQYAEKEIKDISVLNSRSVKDDPPMPGDYVYLDFINNDFSKAIILTILRKNDADVNRTGKDIEQSLYSQNGGIL